jgi:hypothetical protein
MTRPTPIHTFWPITRFGKKKPPINGGFSGGDGGI